jgi:hypothetical protein
MQIVNYDAGWVDPQDAEDLTRARLTGIRQYVRERYDEANRPTYVAAAIGIRQGRHAVTDCVLTFADQMRRSTFPDAIGYQACHMDNHAVDYEFEDDESLFWNWLCRRWRTDLACEIPYRALLPRGLENVWIACRALGVTLNAHYSLRMQRDMAQLRKVDAELHEIVLALCDSFTSIADEGSWVISQVEVVREAVRDGQTLAEIAVANGSSADSLIHHLAGLAEEHLTDLVVDGRITEEQKADMLENMTGHLTDLVNGEIDRPLMDGPGLGGGRHGGMGGPGMGGPCMDGDTDGEDAGA